MMKYVFALLLVVASGCTPLLVKEPVGSKFTSEELNELEGTWMLQQSGKEPTPVHLKKVNDTGLFRTAHVEWKNREKYFQLHQSDLILRKGEEFGILHLVHKDDAGHPLFLISLFKLDADGKLRHWTTDNEAAKKFLESGQLKTKEVAGELVIMDEPEKVVRVIESSFEQIFDVDQVTKATKLSSRLE
jgi:hypothetical protein